MIVTDNVVRQFGRVSSVPFQWIASDVTTTQQKLADIEAGYARIPATIRQPLEQWFTDPSFPNKRLRFSVVVGNSANVYAQYPVAGPSGELNWSGLYLPGDAAKPWQAASACIVTEYANRDRTMVHEFAHHLDHFGDRLLFQSPQPQRLLFVNDMRIFNFAVQVSPSIPEGVYGKGDPYEWFAEMFTRQILEDAQGVIDLCGRGEASTNAGRALFTEMFADMPQVLKPPTVVTQALPPLRVGVPVSVQLEQFGWGHPVSVWETNGAPGFGLTVSTAGVVAGVPTQAGSGSFQVRAANVYGAGAYRTVSFTVTV